MDTYTWKKREYYLLDDLRKANSPCIRRARRGIIKYLASENLVKRKDYLFVQPRKDDSELLDVKDTYSRTYGRILLSKEYVDGYGTVKSNLPPVLELEDHEKFRDNKGNIYDVDVRGERTTKGCFFKAADISKIFNLPHLIKVIHDDDSSYVKDVDYFEFNSAQSEAIIPKNIKETYLSYYGLIRAIMVSRSGIALAFIDWMIETLFAAHLGTSKQKAKLASSLVGVDYPTLKTVCGITHGKISAIYLFYLGKVKDLRHIIDIPDDWHDDDSVFKYGRTNDIRRRYYDHLSGKYSKEKGFNTQLVYMWFISAERCVKAERDLEIFLIENNMKLDHPKHTEIAIYGKDIVKKIGSLFSEYEQQIKVLEASIDKLETEVLLLRKDIENRELEIKTMNLLIDTKDNELSAKDQQYQRMKKRKDKEISDKSNKYKEVKNTLRDMDKQLASKDATILLLEKDLELMQAKYELATLKGLSI